MATRNSTTRGTPETQTLENPVMPYHFKGSNVLWDELAEEAQHYLELIQALKQLPQNHADREVLEVALYGSVAHLEAHARELNEEIRVEMEREG